MLKVQNLLVATFVAGPIGIFLGFLHWTLALNAIALALCVEKIYDDVTPETPLYILVAWTTIGFLLLDYTKGSLVYYSIVAFVYYYYGSSILWYMWYIFSFNRHPVTGN